MALFGGNCEICASNKKSRVISGINMCNDCFDKISDLRKGDPDSASYFLDSNNLKNSSHNAREYIENIIRNTKDLRSENIVSKEQEEKIKEIDEKMDNLSKEFICTSGSVIDGKEVDKYLGFITGVAVLGTSFTADLKASVGDIFGTEITKYEEQFNRAKEIAYKEFVQNCVYASADAAVGVDLKISTMAGNIVWVVVSGTAIKLK